MAHPYFNPVRDEQTFQQSLASAAAAAGAVVASS